MERRRCGGTDLVPPSHVGLRAREQSDRCSVPRTSLAQRRVMSPKSKETKTLKHSSYFLEREINRNLDEFVELPLVSSS